MALYDSIIPKDPGAFDAYHEHQVIIGNLAIPMMFRFTQNPNRLTFRMEKEYKQTRTVGGYVYEHWGKKPTMMHGEVLIKKDGSSAQLIGLNTGKTGFDIEDKSFNPELFTLQTLFDVDQRRVKGSSSDLIRKGLNKLATAADGIVGGVIDLVQVKNPFKKSKSGTYESLVDESVYTEPDQSSMKGYMKTLTDTFIYYKGCIYSGFFVRMDWEEDGETPFTNKVTFDFLVTGTTYDWIETMLVTTGVGRIVSGVWGAASMTTTLGSLLKDIFKF